MTGRLSCIGLLIFQEFPCILSLRMRTHSVLFAGTTGASRPKIANGLTITWPYVRAGMYFEGLAVEIYATKAGLESVKPPRKKGASGVEHRFSFLADKEGRLCGFDFFPEVGEVEVLKSYAKQLDTGVKTYLICLKGKPTEGGAALLKEYGMRVLGPAEIAPFFDNKEWLEIAPVELSETPMAA